MSTRKLNSYSFIATFCIWFFMPVLSSAQNITIAAGDPFAGSSGPLPSPASGIYIPFVLQFFVDDQDNIFFADDTFSHTHTSIYKVDANTGILDAAVNQVTHTIGLPSTISGDYNGNLYVSDDYKSLFKIDAVNSVSSLVAGTGISGFSGDDGPATSAQIDNIIDVEVDAAGHIYIADAGNNRIRKVDADTGIITTIAGNGTNGSAGDGGLAINAALSLWRIELDPAGNLYLIDGSQHRVRKIDATTGIITTVAGTGNPGFSGDGGPATSADMNLPFAIAVDGGGHLFISDYNNFRIRRVDAATGIITTVAGTGNRSFAGEGGPAISADLEGVNGLYMHSSGDLYTSEPGTIRKIDGIGVPLANTSPLVVSLTDTTTTYKESLSLPVRVTDTTDEGIVAVELFVSFSAASSTDGLLSTTAPTASIGNLTSGWALEHNVASGGASGIDTLKIAMATDTDALSGEGTLATLHFSVADRRAPTSSILSIEHLLFNDGVPTAIPNDGSVALVGSDGHIAAAVFSSGSTAQVVPGETVTVTVTDVDENRDSGLAESFAVQASNGAQSETLLVVETGAATGIFTGSIATSFSLAASSGDGTLQVQSGDTVQFCFSDSLDSNGTTVQRCDSLEAIGGEDGRVSATVVSQPGDTLRVRVIDGDLNADPNAQETAQITATNPTTGESETIELSELSIDDSTFFGIVKTAPGNSPGPLGDGVLNTAKGDVLDIAYADQLTTQGGLVNRSDDSEVIDPFGDADGNGQTQAFDAARTLLHVLSPFLTGADSLAANLDLLAYDPLQGKITPFDASLILQKRVGLIDRFPVQEDEADNHPQPETDSSTPKRLSDERVLSWRQEGDYLGVWIDRRDGIVAGDLIIEGIEGQVRMGREFGEFLTAAHPTKEGIHFVFAGAQALEGTGELLRLYGAQSETIRMARAQFNDGHIAVQSGANEQMAIPVVFALHANWPNPFNPETTIRFDLPQAGHIALEVYDMLGQKVRTLVRGDQSAGTYQVRWNGRNEQDNTVASGVYFYRLQTEKQTAMRRMLLLK